MAASDGSSNGNRLEGKVTIITGGASGIGEETVRQFVRHGARVVIADVHDEKGAAVASSLGLDRCTYVHCDVTDEQMVESLVDSTVRTHGRLDVVFCNAGIASLSKQDVLEFDAGNYERLFSVNVRGLALCVKHSARAMVAGGRSGSIICTGSVVGEMGAPIYIDYAMSKHAVLGFMRSASKQLGQYGVRVNCVSPSAVATPLLCSLYGLEADEVERAFASSSCMKGVLKAKHVADAAVFLASDESEFINGHNLVIDGGQNFK